MQYVPWLLNFYRFFNLSGWILGWAGKAGDQVKNTTKSQRSPKCEISGAWSEELQSLNPEILWSSLFSFVNSDMKADFQQVCLPWSSCASGCVEVRRTAWAPVPLCGNGSRGLGYLISWRGNRWDLVVGQYLEKRAWCEGRLENDIHVWYLSGWQYNTKIWYYAIYIYVNLIEYV